MSDVTMRMAVSGSHLDASSVTINFLFWSLPEAGRNSFRPYPRGCRRLIGRLTGAFWSHIALPGDDSPQPPGGGGSLSESGAAESEEEEELDDQSLGIKGNARCPRLSPRQKPVSPPPPAPPSKGGDGGHEGGENGDGGAGPGAGVTRSSVVGNGVMHAESGGRESYVVSSSSDGGYNPATRVTEGTSASTPSEPPRFRLDICSPVQNLGANKEEGEEQEERSRRQGNGQDHDDLGNRARGVHQIQSLLGDGAGDGDGSGEDRHGSTKAVDQVRFVTLHCNRGEYAMGIYTRGDVAWRELVLVHEWVEVRALQIFLARFEMC